MNKWESYFEYSLELKESNTSSYHKALQKLYKTVKEIDPTAVIIRYQSEEDKEEISKKNNTGVRVIVNNTLLNSNEALLNYL